MYVWAIAITVVILIIYMMTNIHRDAYEKYLSGFWIGDKAFCEESDVSQMLLFIGEKENTRRQVYILITPEITNQIATMKMNASTTWGWSVGKHSWNCQIDFEEDCGIPEKVKFHLDMINGILKIHDSKTMYGIFYKDAEVTNLVSN
jgi:hypothetical protein